MRLSQATIDALISQYRGELSAVEAYEWALSKYGGQPEEMTLLRLQGEHRAAVKRLGETIRRSGGVVPESSGAWGTFAVTVEKLASLINDEVPLQVLYRGEALGCDGYERVLADPHLPPDLETELTMLNERCHGHLEVLREMIQQVPEAPNRPML